MTKSLTEVYTQNLKKNRIHSTYIREMVTDIYMPASLKNMLIASYNSMVVMFHRIIRLNVSTYGPFKLGDITKALR